MMCLFLWGERQKDFVKKGVFSDVKFVDFKKLFCDVNNFPLDKRVFMWYSIKTMTNELDKFKEGMAQAMFGRSAAIAKAGGQCVSCGEFNLEFRDELSRKEYGISGLCQCCQDSVFGTEEE